ncbi:response regulator [Paeniroseomonas aquatica]|uniref:response regulator n=1 Tax=Paeniroseomonas aquatica TaxID=373043 RepID=UPI00361D58D2
MMPVRTTGGGSAGLPLRDALDREPHVVIVEDDSEVRYLLTRLLRENGFVVSAARDGREMREVLRAATPPAELVLLDIMLPGTSGMDLLREIRATSRVPVVMLTARGEETDRVLGLEWRGRLHHEAFRPARARGPLARRVAACGWHRSRVRRAIGHKGRCLAFAGWRLETGRRELTSRLARWWTFPGRNTTC